jgi:ComF family protein
MRKIMNACFVWLEAGIDILFPPHCVVCGEQGEDWCSRCQSQVQVLEQPMCPRCGTPHVVGSVCRRCATIQHIDAVRSYAWYWGAIVSPILTLKYRPNKRIARQLGQCMAGVVRQAGWQPVAVLPVPLGQARFKQRGYNQAGLLAAALAGELSLEFEPQALVRRRETASQVGLDRRGRMENVRLAFRALSQYVCGRRILVVDDLLTSGATLSYCALSLKQAGAKAVYGITVARARRTV